LELLARAHLQIENLERDIECLNIYGQADVANLQFQSDVLAQSKFIANSFSSIIADIAT
jgi:hypothetical protein